MKKGPRRDQGGKRRDRGEVMDEGGRRRDKGRDGGGLEEGRMIG
jgi:hypothetical protein